MTEAEITTIGKVIDLCRAKGVRVLANDGFRIELGDPVEKLPPASGTKPIDLNVCRCGHGEHMHTNGQCLNGCDAEKCLPLEKT